MRDPADARPRAHLRRKHWTVGVHQRANGAREAADLITKLMHGRFATRRDPQ